MKGFVILLIIAATIAGAYFFFPDLRGIYSNMVNDKPTVSEQQ